MDDKYLEAVIGELRAKIGAISNEIEFIRFEVSIIRSNLIRLMGDDYKDFPYKLRDLPKGEING